MLCDDRHFDDHLLPAVEAVLAGTLALMTGCGEVHCPLQRRRMQERIVANLELLAAHPQLSEPFRCVVDRLRGRWEQLLSGEPAAPASKVLHRAPETLQ